MINDKQIAIQIIQLMDKCSEEINVSIREVQGSCSEDEFRAYRRSAGKVMGAIYIDVVAQLYKKHPDLEPECLKVKTDGVGGP